MKLISNVSSLCDMIQQKINESLNEEVAKMVKKTMVKAINQEVYGKYTPSKYVRRMTQGGLSDQENIVSEIVENGVLSVFNITSPRPSVINVGYNDEVDTILSQWIEYGQVPNIFNNFNEYYWTNPRPFMRITMEMLQSNGKIKTSLIRGLKKRKVNII